jgi:hypothetical protein
MRVSVTAQSKASVCGRFLVWIACSNPVGGMDVSVVSVVCCQVEVSATGRSPVQRSPTECGVSVTYPGIFLGVGLRPLILPMSETRILIRLLRMCFPRTGNSA